eukprot:TRINITY_DN5768_c0_g1_i5.p1 TRINITY_DN5768_c0_g1~~TRINITY_DN5768_c0_g1_i5.p1  ORF type:complete len:417 (+),score=83.84 TRINITY_DN5768_c0_g1_i5:216-1466(+)
MEEKQILACFRTIRDKAQQEYELQIGISSTSESQFFIKSSIIHFIFPTCAAGDVEGLRVLLERIGCVDETDHAGQTALHHAVLARSLECCKFLCEEFGSSLNIIDNHGFTPLEIANRCSFSEIYNYLINHRSLPCTPLIPKKNSERRTNRSNTTRIITMQVKSSELVYGEEMGKGCFGVVYKGRWRCLPVAIKKIRVECQDSLQDLLQDAVFMLNLRPHPNIVSLLGVCFEPSNYAIIMEYLACGSLDKVLEDPSEFNEVDKILQTLVDVALGMAHLHSEGILHRDLAARNVLLTNEIPRRAKIADFGFSKINKHDGGSARWLAPECILHNAFSVYSDTWSYGILCYEITSKEPPHKGTPIDQLLPLLARAVVPTMPVGAPKVLKKLVKSCWNLQPRDRPTFQKIIGLFIESGISL